MSFTEISIFFAVSFVAAAINSVAGGGTFLTFPVFMFGGLTALQANIMSTIALWPGTIASVIGYRSIWKGEMKRFISFLLIGLIGGVIGAELLLSTPEITFRRLVPWLLLAATLIFTFGKHVIAWLRKHSVRVQDYWLVGLLLQLVIAVYGGYFGAGIGILTLAMLQIMGFSNIHHMNALKTVLTCAINVATVIIFACSGNVLWNVAWIMVAGAVSGGYVGARLALRVSPEKIRWLVSAIGVAMTAYFFLHRE